MANTNQKTLLERDAYLIIVAGENKNKLQILPYDKQQANSSQNLLDNQFKNTIANVALAGITSPIVQNYAGKYLSNATLGRINSSLYDIMADGKISNQEVAEDFIGSCTNALDNMFTDLGFPTPSALYTAISPTGSGVISKDFAGKFLNLFGKQSEQEIKNREQQKLNIDNVLIIKFKLIDGDSESLGISIPTRKTEKNFNIATSINNENPVRNFTAKIVHNPNKNINMYDIKRQLYQLRDMREYINVYICDNDVLEVEILEDYLLSDLSFDIEGKNALNCSLSITKVPDWEVTIDTTLDKNLYSNTINSGSAKRKVSGNKIKNKKTKTSVGKTITVGNITGDKVTNLLIDNYKKARDLGDIITANMKIKILTDRLNANKASFGYKFTELEVKTLVDNGAIVIKI